MVRDWEIRNCPECGNTFKTLKGSNRKYCSPKCAQTVRLQQQINHYHRKNKKLYSEPIRYSWAGISGAVCDDNCVECKRRKCKYD